MNTSMILLISDRQKLIFAHEVSPKMEHADGRRRIETCSPMWVPQQTPHRFCYSYCM